MLSVAIAGVFGFEGAAATGLLVPYTQKLSLLFLAGAALVGAGIAALDNNKPLCENLLGVAVGLIVSTALFSAEPFVGGLAGMVAGYTTGKFGDQVCG